MPLHKKGDLFLGYMITIDSLTFYFAGDTDFIPEMKKMKNITYAFLPIGEGKTAMNPLSAAAAATVIKPRFVIPFHYETEKNSEYKFWNAMDQPNSIIFLLDNNNVNN